MNDIADQSVGFGRIAAMIPVKDMDVACQFYCGALGFKKVFENGNPVGFMILKREEGELHLSLQRNHKAANFNIAHMLVKDVDAMHAICKRYGMRIIKGLQDKDYGLRAFVFEDPDGNRIDVGQKASSSRLNERA
ncbi:glyoxalase superfamily protein [Brucella pituitosa]|uniref:VOC family protein n=1 Tax=Brucella pituitosa TaxID=571256 RepID=A0ABS3JZ60_9HYPH|nr:glyoxalase superfamily protein [Brucella pituitosa]MBO1039350.1 VOC family protein [Brucella pituitosa]